MNITLERAGAVGVLRIDGEGETPVLSRPLLEAKSRLLAEADADPGLRCLVITGSGRIYLAGADLGGLEEPSEALAFNRELIDVAAQVENLSTPTIFAFNGHCFGAGLEISLAGSIRVAAAGAKIGLPETTVGLLPGTASMERLFRTVPRGGGLKMVLTGDPLPAEEAFRLGVIDQVVDGADFDAEVLTLATRIAGNAPLATRAVVEVERSRRHSTPEEVIDMAHERLEVLFASGDFKEGLAAFREKREPDFQGS
ncbi:MAG: enoyl-CoA hydratase/isomerase family protein [Actinomycetota bacterium]|nr:enoyl-CoA hydratase/isomerase family protein [Actinomycetota bacterium]